MDCFKINLRILFALLILVPAQAIGVNIFGDSVSHNLEVWFCKTRMEEVGTDYKKSCFSDDFLREVGESCKTTSIKRVARIVDSKGAVAVYDKYCFSKHLRSCGYGEHCFSKHLKSPAKSEDLKSSPELKKLKPTRAAKFFKSTTRPFKKLPVQYSTKYIESREQLLQIRRECLKGQPYKEPKPISIGAEALQGTNVNVYDFSSGRIVCSKKISGNEIFILGTGLHLSGKAGKFPKGTDFPIYTFLNVPQNGKYRVEIRPKYKGENEKPITVDVQMEGGGSKQILVDVEQGMYAVRDPGTSYQTKVSGEMVGKRLSRQISGPPKASPPPSPAPKTRKSQKGIFRTILILSMPMFIFLLVWHARKRKKTSLTSLPESISSKISKLSPFQPIAGDGLVRVVDQAGFSDDSASRDNACDTVVKNFNAHLERGDYDQARIMLKNIQEIKPIKAVPEFYYAIARQCENKNEIAFAGDIYQLFMNKQVDYKDVAQRYSRLKEILLHRFFCPTCTFR